MPGPKVVHPATRSATLLLVVDLAGTFVFALEGAMRAVAADLDLLGLTVLAFAVALGGGIIRDVLIGDVPPAAIRDWRYPVTAFVGAGAVFALHAVIGAIPAWLLIGLDAAGLSLFAVAGTAKALAFGLNPLMAVMMGTITGVGGGTLRDVLLAQIPAVLRTDIYATAAMAGAAVMVVGVRMRGTVPAMGIIGGFVCFLLRVVAVWQHWSLPHLLRP